MTKSTAKNDFGKSLRSFRYQARSDDHKPLSQEKLAEIINTLQPGMELTRDTIYKWERGLRTIRQDNRNLLVLIIKALAATGGIACVCEANQLLKSGGYKDLEEDEIRGIQFPQAAPGFVHFLPGKSVPPNEGVKTHPASGGFNRNFDPMNFQRTDRFYDRVLPDYANEALFPQKEHFPYKNAELYYAASSARFLGTAPNLPSLFIGRKDDLQALKKHLGQPDRENNHTVQVLTAIRGWPGVGKTTVAAALAYEEDMIQKYCDGVLWVSLGTQPRVLANLITWGKSLHILAIQKAHDVDEASAILAGSLRDKRLLLIIDDVWEAMDARPFFIGGHGCATLVTTRSQEVANQIAASSEQIYPLGALSPTYSLELLQKLAPQVVVEHPSETEKLLRKLEGLPLALQVAGHLLQSEYEMGFSIDELFDEINEGTRLLREKAPIRQNKLASETTPSVAALLYKSLDHLDPFVRRCYAHLGAVTPSPAKFDIEFLRKVWETPDPQSILRVLVGRGLLEYSPREKMYQMHSLLVMLARSIWNEEYKGNKTL